MEKEEDFNLESGSRIIDSELESRNELGSGRTEWSNLLGVIRVCGEPGNPLRVDSELVFKVG